MFRTTKTIGLSLLPALSLVLVLDLWATAQDKTPIEEGQEKAAKDLGPELSSVPGVSIRKQSNQILQFGFIKSNFIPDDGMRHETVGYPPIDMVQTICPIVRTRIFGASALPKDKYVIRLDSPARDKAAGLQKLSSAYEQAFKIRLVLEEREIPCFILRRGEDWEKSGLPKAKKDDDGTSSDFSFSLLGNPRHTAKCSGTIDDFADKVESAVKSPVFNETGIQGSYSAEYEYYEKNAAANLTEFCKQHGLDLVSDKRKVLGVFVEALKDSK